MTDKERGAHVREALERVLSHAESHGEVYYGAIEDHGTLRAAITETDAERDDDTSDDKGTPSTVEGAEP